MANVYDTPRRVTVWVATVSAVINDGAQQEPAA